MTMFKPALRCAAALAALGLSTAAAADALVVRSTGPSAASYPVGRRLPDTERVVLRTGDRVVIVAQGGTRTLSGPGNFPVRATVQTTQGRSTTLNRYLSASGGSISRTGAVRGSVQQQTPPACGLSTSLAPALSAPPISAMSRCGAPTCRRMPC